MASAVPYAKTNLLAIVQAALPGVQVTWGHPGQYIAPEAVWLADAVFDDEQSSVGQVSHREEFLVPVVVSVKQDGDDAQATELRAWELVADIETAVRADPSLTDAQGVTGAVVDGKTPHTYTMDAARLAEITVDINVTSRF